MTKQAKRAAAQCIAQALRDLKSGKTRPASYQMPGLSREETTMVEELAGENLSEGRYSEMFLIGMSPPR